MFSDSMFVPVCANVIAFLKYWLVKIIVPVTKVFSLELKNIVSFFFFFYQCSIVLEKSCGPEYPNTAEMHFWIFSIFLLTLFVLFVRPAFYLFCISRIDLHLVRILLALLRKWQNLPKTINSLKSDSSKWLSFPFWKAK